MNEIITRAERTTTGETEPTLTLSQLQGLLRAAAELERAQRPIVVHSAPQPATTAQTAPAGASVYVPMPPAAAFAPVAVDRPRNIWPLLFMVSGCTGLAAAGTAAATGNEFAILAFFACVAAWGTATYHLVFER